MPQIKKIKIRRGLNTALPAGGTEAGELRYSTDTKELFIDDGSVNVKVGKDIDALSTELKNRANHTGTQAQSTITNLTTDLAAKQATLTNDQLNALAQIVSTPTRSIPAMTANTTAGGAGNYIASANSEFNASYASWRAMRITQGTPTDEWATLGVLTNIWLQMLFPTARVITSARVASRASGSENPAVGWRIEASNDGVTWTTLYTSATVMSNTIATVSFTNATAYTQYRMFSPTTQGTNPGMSFLEFRHDVIGFATAPTV